MDQYRRDAPEYVKDFAADPLKLHKKKLLDLEEAKAWLPPRARFVDDTVDDRFRAQYFPVFGVVEYNQVVVRELDATSRHNAIAELLAWTWKRHEHHAPGKCPHDLAGFHRPAK